MRIGKQAVSQIRLMSVGRLFQTSGPLTENARRPNCVLVRRTTVDLVVDDRSWCWWALRLNATRSLRYEGECWWKILYINITTLKVIWNFIGSQWSCLRAGVMWDWRLRPRMSRVQLHSEPVGEGQVLRQEDRLVRSYSSQYEIWQET